MTSDPVGQGLLLENVICSYDQETYTDFQLSIGMVYFQLCMELNYHKPLYISFAQPENKNQLTRNNQAIFVLLLQLNIVLVSLCMLVP